MAIREKALYSSGVMSVMSDWPSVCWISKILLLLSSILVFRILFLMATITCFCLSDLARSVPSCPSAFRDRTYFRAVSPSMCWIPDSKWMCSYLSDSGSAFSFPGMGYL